MWSYILTFLGGIATGVGLLLAHQWSVRRAVQIEQTRSKREADKLRGHIDRLREDCQALELSAETARARAAGKIVGIQEGRNMSQAEKLMRELEGQSGRRVVQLGSCRGAGTGGRSAATTSGEDTAQPYRSCVAATRPEGVAEPTQMGGGEK